MISKNAFSILNLNKITVSHHFHIFRALSTFTGVIIRVLPAVCATLSPWREWGIVEPRDSGSVIRSESGIRFSMSLLFILFRVGL